MMTTSTPAPLTPDEVAAEQAGVVKQLLACLDMGWALAHPKSGRYDQLLTGNVRQALATIDAQQQTIAALEAERDEWQRRAHGRLRRADQLLHDLEAEHIESTGWHGLYRRLLDEVTDVMNLDPNAWDTEGGDDLALAAIVQAVKALVAERAALLAFARAIDQLPELWLIDDKLWANLAHAYDAWKALPVELQDAIRTPAPDARQPGGGTE